MQCASLYGDLGFLKILMVLVTVSMMNRLITLTAKPSPDYSITRPDIGVKVLKFVNISCVGLLFIITRPDEDA